MRIMKIYKCSQCPYISHLGAFTEGGAKNICDHEDAVFWATNSYTIDRYHWKHRIVNPNTIPKWCKLS